MDISSRAVQQDGAPQAWERTGVEDRPQKQPAQQEAVIGAGTDDDEAAPRQNASPVCYASQFSDYAFVGAH